MTTRLYRTACRCKHCRELVIYSDQPKELLLGMVARITDWYTPDGQDLIPRADRLALCPSCGKPLMGSALEALA